MSLFQYVACEVIPRISVFVTFQVVGASRLYDPSPFVVIHGSVVIAADGFASQPCCYIASLQSFRGWKPTYTIAS